MDVAARLSAPLLSHLRSALQHEHALTVADDWEQLVQLVRVQPIDVVVVDPRADGTVDVAPIRSLVELFPTVPVVLYTVLTPDTLRATVFLARSGVRHVVLRGFDDEPQRLRELIARIPAYRLSDQVLQGLAPRLAPGPPLLLRAVTRLFETPHQFQSVEDLAHAAGMTRRNLDRWLDRLGMASARMLILGARLVRALYYMRDPGYMLDDITKKLGYRSPRLFARQVRAATGLTPSALRARAEHEQFTTELTAWLSRRGGRTNEGV